MTYTYIKDGKTFGPFTVQELDQAQARGSIRYDQMVIPDNGDEPLLVGRAIMKDRAYGAELQARQAEAQRAQRRMSEAAVPGVFRSAELFAPIVLCGLFSGGFCFAVYGILSEDRWNSSFLIRALITGLLALASFGWARARLRKARKD